MNLSGEVEELFRGQMREFLAWAEANWIATAKDRHDDAFRDQSDDHIAGYNAGIASMQGAFECWIEEFPV